MKEAALKILARLRDDKKLETLVYALLACVVAAAFLAGGGANCHGKTVTERESPEKPASTEAELESRLEAILSQIKGAGRVRVMITFDRGSEIVPARESQRSTGENGSNESSKPLTVSSSGGQSDSRRRGSGGYRRKERARTRRDDRARHGLGVDQRFLYGMN